MVCVVGRAEKVLYAFLFGHMSFRMLLRNIIKSWWEKEFTRFVVGMLFVVDFKNIQKLSSGPDSY